MAKKKRTSRRSLPVGVIILLLVLAYVLSHDFEQPAAEPSIARQPEASSGLELPAPLPAGDELILKRRGYTASYHRTYRQPRWVAWELNAEKLIEREARTDKFLPDPELEPSEAVTTDDYKGSGYDRGHMCPAGDNRWHWRAMQESFYMTNICPQLHKLNNGDWKELEEACRRWVGTQERLYIVCGPLFEAGRGKYIGGEHRVRVPEAFFKVVLGLNPPQAIGFVFRNEGGNRELSTYVRTVDEVERLSGLDFFPALSDEVEAAVESRCDLSAWE